MKQPELITNRKYRLKLQSIAANKKTETFTGAIFLTWIVLITYLLRTKTDYSWIKTILIAFFSLPVLFLLTFGLIELAMRLRKVIVQKRLISLFEIYQRNLSEEKLENIDSIKVREKLFKKMRRIGADNFHNLKVYKNDLANIDLSYCSFDTCTFEKCNLSNSNFYDSAFDNCSILESNLDFAKFTYSSFRYNFNFSKSIMTANTSLEYFYFERRSNNEGEFNILEEFSNQQVIGIEIIKSKFISRSLGFKDKGNIMPMYMDIFRIEKKLENP